MFFQTAPSDTETVDYVPAESVWGIARATFLAWEKLRLVYIVTLGAATVALSFVDRPLLLYSFKFWAEVGVGAVVANLCYFAGPAIETYATWLGVRTPWIRPTLFVLGTLFTFLLAVCMVMSILDGTLFV